MKIIRLPFGLELARWTSVGPVEPGDCRRLLRLGRRRAFAVDRDDGWTGLLGTRWTLERHHG